MSDKQIKDTGIVIALIFLVLGSWGNGHFLLLSGLFLIITILFPKILYPFAFVWLKIINIFELIVPKIFFSLIFFLLVAPVGWIMRKVFNNDLLQLSAWKKSASAFFERNHRFVKKDFETPY
jgi:cellulose synthase/poly-beta-1,6-N-acetylglucosamine synthase-like glycosyltransferase